MQHAKSLHVLSPSVLSTALRSYCHHSHWIDEKPEAQSPTYHVTAEIWAVWMAPVSSTLGDEWGWAGNIVGMWNLKSGTESLSHVKMMEIKAFLWIPKLGHPWFSDSIDSAPFPGDSRAVRITPLSPPPGQSVFPEWLSWSPQGWM